MLPQEQRRSFLFKGIPRRTGSSGEREEYRELADLKHAIDQAAIVTTSDVSGKIVYANDMALRVYGYGREEMIGRNHRLLNSGVHSREFFRNLWQTILAGEVWRGEICNKAKDGSLHWLDTTIIPFLDDDGKPHQFMSIRKDITEKKRIEEDLRHEQRKRSTIERLSAVGEMASNIAHEIKNPIAAIQLQVQILRRHGAAGALSQEMALGGLEKIDSIVTRISRIIAGLLSLSRNAESDPMERVSTKSLIDSTLEFCAGNLESKGISILRCGSGEESFLDCRPIQISQVLLNLINNARDAVEHLEEKWVRIGVETVFGTVQVSVTDSGTGLTPKVRARMMEPFFNTKKDGKGTGLGLSISRKILEMHGGELVLLSSRNTCFQIRLPEAARLGPSGLA